MKVKKYSLNFGAELFRQAFMAIDYIEAEISSRRRILLPPAFKLERSATDVNRQDHDPQDHDPQDHDLRNQEVEKTSKTSFLRERRSALREFVNNERGDVPGWVLVVLMTTGLVTAIWAVAAPRLNAILKNSLDSMNNIR